MSRDLCERCRQLFALQSLRELSGGVSRRHGQVQDIIASARDRCSFCGLICHVTLCQYFGKPPDYEEIYVMHDPDDWIRVRVVLGSSSKSSLIDFIEIDVEGDDDSRGRCRVFTAKDDPASYLTMGRPVETDVSSPIVVAEARKLISTCARMHPECSAIIAHSQPPARVLDVFEIGTSHAILTSTNANLGKKLEYIALSYCWGIDQPIKLLKSNKIVLEQEGALITSLPKCLQDAVECTRALGYRYLWADALCIIQDSEDDKLREISNMASIYRDSAVTIVAAVARSAFESFLEFDRLSSLDAALEASNSMAKQCLVDIDVGNGSMGLLTIVPSVEGRELTRNMPVNCRGWCLQESILPRRLLLYGPQELLFRCRTMDCQSVISNVIDYSGGIDPPIPSSYEQREPDSRRVWNRLVHDYTNRKTSIPEDRVYAIAGIINELERKWSDKCIFGIWKSRLLEDMCWTRTDEQTTTRSPHAPSWSWMSVDGRIAANYRDFEDVDAKLTSIGEDKTIYMTCRVMTQSQSTRIRPMGLPYGPDLGTESDERSGKPVNFIYIGPARWKDIDLSTPHYFILALAVIEVDDGVFKRVGIFEKAINKFHGVGDWTSLPRRSIALL